MFLPILPVTLSNRKLGISLNSTIHLSLERVCVLERVSRKLMVAREGSTDLSINILSANGSDGAVVGDGIDVSNQSVRVSFSEGKSTPCFDVSCSLEDYPGVLFSSGPIELSAIIGDFHP